MEGIMAVINRFGWVKAKTAEVDERHIRDREELLEELAETAQRISAIECCFNLETNSDMIDSYIMELDSLEKRYSYLIKKAKMKQIAAF